MSKEDRKKTELPPIIDDDGINLMPILTKKEVVAEKKKVTLNVGSVISIVIFLAITIGVVAFSAVSKVQLNQEKEKLFELETEVKAQSSKILSNQEILKRVNLYRDISSTQFSARKIFEYFTGIAEKQGDISLSSFVFGSGTVVSFEGEGDSLDTVSKFWYLLNEDELVKQANMESISRGEESVRFSFKVELVKDSFKREQVQNNINENKVENDN